MSTDIHVQVCIIWAFQAGEIGVGIYVAHVHTGVSKNAGAHVQEGYILQDGSSQIRVLRGLDEAVRLQHTISDICNKNSF